MRDIPESAMQILKKVKGPSIETMLEDYLYTGYISYRLDTHSSNKTDIQSIEEFCRMVYIDWRNSLIENQSSLGPIEKIVAEALEKYEKFNPENIDARKNSSTIYYDFFYQFYDKYFKHTGTRPMLLQDGKTILPEENFLPDGFLHVWGHVITRQKSEPVEARLYLNLKGENIGKFAIEAYKKCKERGLPFYFKFSSNDSRNDPFLFYSSYKNLAKYVEIIEEIKKENPHLLEGTELVSRNMGVINGYIGYGDEPTIENESYNSTRREAFSVIRTKLYDERKNKFSTKNTSIFASKPKQMTYDEYIEFMLDAFVEKNFAKMKTDKNFTRMSRSIKERAKKAIESYILEGKPLEEISINMGGTDIKIPLNQINLGTIVKQQGGSFNNETELRGTLARYAFFSSNKLNEDEKNLNRVIKELLVQGIKQDSMNPNLKETCEKLLEKLDRKNEDLDATGKALVLLASANFIKNGRIYVHTKKHNLVYDEMLPQVYKAVIGEEKYNDIINETLKAYNISSKNLCFNQDTEEQLKTRSKE